MKHPTSAKYTKVQPCYGIQYYDIFEYMTV